MSPLESRAKELWHNVPALMFLDYWQRRDRQAALKDEGRMLGVLWTREDVEDDPAEDRRKQPANELRIPLSCIIEPGILDMVKQHFGRRMGIDPPEWASAQQPSEQVDLFGTSKEEFLKFVRGFVSPKIS